MGKVTQDRTPRYGSYLLLLAVVIATAAGVLSAAVAADAPASGSGGAAGAGRSPMTAAVASHLRAQIELIMRRMAVSDAGVRRSTAAELERLGIGAIPLIGRYTNYRDCGAAEIVRNTLIKMMGAVPPIDKRDITLTTISELKLSATLVGSKPRAGEVVTLWITLGNYSTHEVRLIEYGWELRLKPIEGANTAPSEGMTDPEQRELHDFVVLKPGQTAGFLMDAITPADLGELKAAYLEIPLSESARVATPGATVTTREELVSDTIELGYADDPHDPPAEVIAACKQILDDATAAGAALSQAKSQEVWQAAVQQGLRSAADADRLKVFQFACAHPDPVLEDELVDYVGRFGPRQMPTAEILKCIPVFARGLPRDRRGAFYQRLAYAVIHDWPASIQIMNHVDESPYPSDRAAVFFINSQLYARGNRRPQLLDYFAWEHSFSDDPKIRNPQKAQTFIDESLKVMPDQISTNVLVMAMKNDRVGFQRSLRTFPDTNSLNFLAWVITCRALRGSVLFEFATAAMDEAIRRAGPNHTDYHSYLDTKACCMAAAGDYIHALEQEEASYAGRRPTITPDQLDYYYERIVQYTALARATPGEYPQRILAAAKLVCAGPRDALLTRWKTEKDAGIKAEIERVLKANYPKDAVVARTLK